MTDHTKLETTAMDRIEIAKAIYHATPRNKPFELLSAFKRERILAEADAFLAALSVTGCRILGPDEVDPVTVGKAAEVADKRARMAPQVSHEAAMALLIALPDAIRALGRKA